VKLLFVAEYKICDQIWLELTSQKEKCFSAITHSSMHTLISFGEAITTCKKSPEKLFVLLDMYETMSDLEPQVHTYILICIYLLAMITWVVFKFLLLY
jgi:exocyst complex protein 7